MSCAKRSLCTAPTDSALLIMFVGASRLAGTYTCMPSPCSACAHALQCVATMLIHWRFHCSNARAALALAMFCWTWRTTFPLLREIVCSHSSLGSRNRCQLDDCSFVHSFG